MRIYEKISAAEINLIIERDGYCASSRSFLHLAVVGDDGPDSCRSSRRKRSYLRATAQGPPYDTPRKTSKRSVRPADALYGKAQRSGVIAIIGLQVLQKLQQRGAVEPFHLRGAPGHVRSFQGADRNRIGVRYAQLSAKLSEICFHGAKAVFAVIDQVHLVYRRDDVAD